jgi:hypothetical protein
MFNKLPLDLQESVAYKLNVHDRTMLNSVLSKNKQFNKDYDRTLGIIHKAIIKRKVSKVTVKMRDFFNTIPEQEETLKEIKLILPDMFTAEVLEMDRKDYIYTIVKSCNIETYKQLRTEDIYKDNFDNNGKLKTLLYTIATCNPTLFEYIVLNETFDFSLLHAEIPYMLSYIEALKIILKHMNLSTTVVEELYVRSIETMRLDAAELLDAHLKTM